MRNYALIRDNFIANFTGDGWVGNQTAKTYGEGITIQPTTIPVTAVNNTITECAIGIMLRRGAGHVLDANVIENRTLARPTYGLYANETFWLLSGPATATATGNTFRNLTVPGPPYCSVTWPRANCVCSPSAVLVPSIETIMRGPRALITIVPHCPATFMGVITFATSDIPAPFRWFARRTLPRLR